jgi:hypothetical protein
MPLWTVPFAIYFAVGFALVFIGPAARQRRHEQLKLSRQAASLPRWKLHAFAWALSAGVIILWPVLTLSAARMEAKRKRNWIDWGIVALEEGMQNGRGEPDGPLRIAASDDPADYEMAELSEWPASEPAPTDEPAPADEDLGASTHPLRILPHWVFHKNDPDPWPSLLHGHHNSEPLKLDAITGGIYNIHTRQLVQTLKKTNLQWVHEQLLASKDFGDKARKLLAQDAQAKW